MHRLSRPLPRWGVGGWTVFTVTIAFLVALPVLVVLSRVFADSAGIWPHLASTVLPDYIVNTIVLMLGVGAVSAGLGVATAWLVTMHRFPGVRVLEWALLLPLEVPTYVLDYVFTYLLAFAGPAPTPYP